MSRFLRRTALVLGALVLTTALAIAAALWWSLPAAHQTARIPGFSTPGLLAPAQVAFDADGIPRIRAASATDAAAALGFVHARDRMFQMELMRRAASGRLSELAGAATLRIDRLTRTLGLRRRAEAELLTLDPDTTAMLDAYASGVNAWIALRGRFAAPEFILLGTPEQWQPLDSLLWGKTMALYLSGNYRGELARAALSATVPPERLRRLWPGQGGAAARRGTRRNPPRRLPPRLSRALHPARYRQQRVGRRCRPQSHRRAPARRRPPPRLLHAGHLVSRPHRHPGRRARRRHRPRDAVHGPRPQWPHRLDLHHHRCRHPGRVHRNSSR